MLRKLSALDRVLAEINRGVNVLSAPAHATRAYPAGPAAANEPLSKPDRAAAARLMRVNHAGEVSAQALYQGQAFFARSPTVRDSLLRAASEETDHLAWCEQRLRELGGRISLLNPLWYAGSFAIGALAAASSDTASLGFIAETEAQVEQHLQSHLERLPPDDLASRQVVAAMQSDEARHGAEARSHGGAALPQPVRSVMRLISKVMTRSSFWL